MLSGLLPAAAGVSGGKTMWYVTRGSGAVSLVLLTAVVVLGTLGPLRVSAPRWPRFAIATVHRDLSLLAVVFLAIHVASTVLDGFAPIGWLDAVIPFASPYRPLWLGLGTVAFDLVLALIATSMLRVRLGLERWRRIHWLAYACWPVAALHGLGTGSDGAQTWLLALTGACTLTVAGAVVLRVHAADRGGATARWYALTIATPVAIGLFALLGPLAPGWASRAGTPATLLGAHAASAPADLVRTGFTTAVDGRMRETRLSTGALIDMSLALAVDGLLRIRLAGHELKSGGVALSGSQVDLVLGTGSPLTGRLRSLHGTRLVARVRAGSGARLTLRGELVIDARTDIVTGRISATPDR